MIRFKWIPERNQRSATFFNIFFCYERCIFRSTSCAFNDGSAAKQKRRIQLTNICKKHPYQKHLKNTNTILRRPHFCCEAFGPLLSNESDLGPPQPSAATQPLTGCIPTSPCARGCLECHDGKDAAQHHSGEFLVRLRFEN